MAVTEKYHIRFIDTYGQVCKVRIFTQDHFAPIYYLTGSEEPVKITWKGDDELIGQSTITSEAVISIVEDKTSGAADDFCSMKEGQYAVIIEQWNADETTRNYVWLGQLIPDYLLTSISNVHAKISLKAICPLSLMKGKMYTSPFNKYYTGVWDLGHFILPYYGFNDGGFSSLMIPYMGQRVITNISLTPDYQTDLMIDIGAYAESFYNSDGKPKSMFENVEQISQAFFLRAFFDNGYLQLLDPLVYPNHSTTPVTVVSYKAHNDYNADTDALLLGNEESIKMLPSYGECKTSFSYKKPTGLLINGLMNNWTDIPLGGGVRLTDWTPNDALLLSPTYGSRRVGNGRAESPYGIKLIKVDEATSAKMQFEVRTGDVIKLETKVKLLSPSKGLDAGTSVWHDLIGQLVNFEIVALNLLYPSQSWYLDWNMSAERNYWEEINLEFTRFYTHNEWDYGVSFVGAGINVSLDMTSVIQQVSAEAPAIAAINEGDDVPYRIFVKLKTPYPDAIGSPTITDNPSEFYSLIATINGERGVSSEVSYLTRKNNSTIKQISREIELQTTDNISIAGSLLAQTSYNIGGDTFAPNYIKSLYRYGMPNQYNLRLTEINSVSNMWINDPNNYKIDMRLKSKLIPFRTAFNMSRLVDSSRPSTSKFSDLFIPNAMTWEMKKNQYRVTAVCTKKAIKPWMVGADVPTELQDLLEHYKV